MALQKKASQSVSLPIDLIERLERTAHGLRTTRSQIILEVLLKALPEYEQRLAVDEPAYAARVAKTPARS